MFKKLQTSVVTSTKCSTYSFIKIDNVALPIFWYFSICDNRTNKVSNYFHMFLTTRHYHFTSNTGGCSCLTRFHLHCTITHHVNRYIRNRNRTSNSMNKRKTTFIPNKLRIFWIALRGWGWVGVGLNSLLRPLLLFRKPWVWLG